MHLKWATMCSYCAISKQCFSPIFLLRSIKSVCQCVIGSLSFSKMQLLQSWAAATCVFRKQLRHCFADMILLRCVAFRKHCKAVAAQGRFSISFSRKHCVTIQYNLSVHWDNRHFNSVLLNELVINTNLWPVCNRWQNCWLNLTCEQHFHYVLMGESIGQVINNFRKTEK